MKPTYLIVCLFLATSLNAQWIDDTSCNKKAEKITNEAIEHAFNLEQLIALGMVKSALMIDDDCGCAQLLEAHISSSNKNWGIQKEKLAAINYKKLSAQEKMWHEVLMADQEETDNTLKKAVQLFPKSPLFHMMQNRGMNWKGYRDFAEKFPDYAAAAYNMISYGYAYGEYGEVDFDMAQTVSDKSLALHNGPNILDSKAEQAYMQKDYDKALTTQLKAVAIAPFGSPYARNARKYWHLKNKAKIEKRLIEKQDAMQKAILDNDKEAFKKMVHSEMPFFTGDSNMQAFYKFDLKMLDQADPVKWQAFELYDHKVHFDQEMLTAVITFNAKGSYTHSEETEPIKYHTRASAVWINTNEGWKIMHSNWAPKKDGKGIPETN